MSEDPEDDDFLGRLVEAFPDVLAGEPWPDGLLPTPSGVEVLLDEWAVELGELLADKVIDPFGYLEGDGPARERELLKLQRALARDE